MANPQQQAQQFTRLKVEDALSYLDQVKLQFGNQPHVYNEFLDIMKEFKSQTIDTPGVINRVSNLFRGHPDLIVGFNTFLPPGYKIEVSNNETINVHQPGQQMLSFSTADTSPPQLKSFTHPTPSSAGPHVNQGAPAAPPGGAHALYPPAPGRHGNQASPQLPFPPPAPGGQQPGQPVEFNLAISYVNKIKLRFQGQPEIYKQFLEILHRYQKEQRNIKEGVVIPGHKPLSESEVYSQVAKLFQNQDDLLNEFGQFLPDANGSAYLVSNLVSHLPNLAAHPMSANDPLPGLRSEHNIVKKPGPFPHKPAPKSAHLRRPAPSLGGPPSKKSKSTTLKDITLSEAGKYGTLNEYAFFDKVRKAFKNQDVYENFLRCLVLFNQEVVSRNELVQMVQPFLGKYADLYRWFKDFLGYKESGQVEPIPQGALKERISSDLAMEIDFSSCKRYGASYRALPKSYPQPKCSGRSALCKEVLNDLWVSFPSWSEDSTFVTSRKTQYEETIYRCEDERFEVLNDTWVSFPTWSEDSSFVTSKKNSFEENIFRTEEERFQLDIVLETNSSTIRVLEGVHKKLSRMSGDEAAKFRLDNCLGGTSEVIHRKAIQRIYGDKAGDIIDGLKKNPLVAVPLVLRRLKSKDEEWREAQRSFNKVWREQNEKYYLKSLDHQGINFKQNDVKLIRSKALLNEIETIFDERQEMAQEGAACAGGGSGNFQTSAHMYISYKARRILDDAAGLIIHHVKRQTSLHKEDKQRIKRLLHHLLPDLLFSERRELSDDEQEPDEDETKEEKESSNGAKEPEVKKEADDVSGGAAGDSSSGGGGAKTSPSTSNKRETRSTREQKNKESKERAAAAAAEVSPVKVKDEPMDDDVTPTDAGDAQSGAQSIDDEQYTMMLGNNNWYLFLRLHDVLCERLQSIHAQAQKIAEEESRCKRERKESTAIALRLKAPNEVEPEQYYTYFLERVKDLLDGNMEASAFEDALRELFGIHAYIVFTMDKIVQNIVRQLQHLVSDDVCVQAQELYVSERRKGACGGALSTASQRSLQESAYQRAAEQLMSDENCFRFVIYKNEPRLTIELLDTESEPSGEEAAVETERWSSYVEKFVTAVAAGDDDDRSATASTLRSHLADKPVFLPRNIRQSRERNKSVVQSRGGSSTVATSSGGASSSSPSARASTAGDADAAGNDSKDDTKKTSSAADNETESATAATLGDDWQLMDETECKFNVNSYKMVYVVNSESYLYKRLALSRARASHRHVSLDKRARLRAWHDAWIEQHVVGDRKNSCNDWLLGKVGGQKEGRTICRTITDVSKTPYHVYNRYRFVDSKRVTST